MLFRTQSAAVYGIDADLTPVRGEADGNPSITIVGLPDLAVRESRERIRRRRQQQRVLLPLPEVGRLLAARRPLAARLAADGHHAGAGVGAQLPAGADDVEAQGPEDRDEVRPRAGELRSERRQLPRI